jgi:hypothetical protein
MLRSWTRIFSMFFIVQVRGLTRFLIAAFSAGRPKRRSRSAKRSRLHVEPGDRVGRGLDVPVADVQVARRVVVHRQQVELRAGRVGQVGPMQAQLVPARLPAGLDLGGLIAIDPGAHVHDGPRNAAPPGGPPAAIEG